MLPNVLFYIGQKVSGLRSKALLLPLVGGSLAFIVLTVLLWPVAGIARRRYSRMLAPDATTRWMHRLSHIVCLFMADHRRPGLPVQQGGRGRHISRRPDHPWLTASHVLGWISCAGFLLLVATAFRFWRAPELQPWAAFIPRSLPSRRSSSCSSRGNGICFRHRSSSKLWLFIWPSILCGIPGPRSFWVNESERSCIRRRSPRG